MKEELASLFEYGEWVNRRLLDPGASLTDDEFNRTTLPGFGSIHLTLVHILGAEVIWSARWEGRSPKALLTSSELPTLLSIRARWAELEEQRHSYFSTVDESTLAAVADWTNTRGQSYSIPRWQIMFHCANHSTHHRSEVAAMLTELGHEPESTDLLEFYLSRAGQKWKPSSAAQPPGSR